MPSLKQLTLIIMMIIFNIIGIKLIRLYEYNQDELKREKYLNIIIPGIDGGYDNYYGSYKSFGLTTATTIILEPVVTGLPDLKELINNKNEYELQIRLLEKTLSDKKDLCERLSNKNKILVDKLIKLRPKNAKIVDPFISKKEKEELFRKYGFYSPNLYPEDPCNYLFKMINKIKINLERDLKKTNFDISNFKVQEK